MAHGYLLTAYNCRRQYRFLMLSASEAKK